MPWVGSLSPLPIFFAIFAHTGYVCRLGWANAPHPKPCLGWALFHLCRFFCNFRAHGPRMRLGGLPATSRRFVAPVSASDPTVDSPACRGWALREANNDFASVFALHTVVSEGSAEAPANTTSAVQPTPFRSSVQGTDSIEPAGPTASISNSPASIQTVHSGVPAFSISGW